MNRESSHLARTMDVLVYGSLLGLAFLLACFPNQDMDIWWHLKTGRAILRGDGIPTQDTYTIAASGHEWIDLHWLFQVAAAYLHDWGGMEALTIAAATVAMLAVSAGILGSSSREIAPFITILWLPALVVMSSRFFVRPEIISLGCVGAYLWVLSRAEIKPALLWLLVPIQVLWVNVQGLFCFGPFFLGCWLIDRWWHAPPDQRRRFPNDTVTPAIFVVLACFANPYGWRGAIYPLQLARTMFVDGAFYREHIGELASPLMVWQATAYRDVYVWMAGLLFAMTAGSFLAAGVRIRLFRVIVFAIFSGLGLTAVRNLPHFAIIAASFLTSNLAERTSQVDDARRYGFSFRAMSLVTLVILTFSVATGRFYGWIGSSRVLGLEEYPHWHAHDAARFAARDGMPEGIAAFHEGQAALVEFLMRDDQRVYVDPRLEVMHREAMESYYALALAIASADENWQDRFTSPTSILIDHSSHFPLEATLFSDPDWTCAWFGPVATVYVPKSAVTAPFDPSGNLARRQFEGAVVEAEKSRAEPQRLRNGLNSDLLEASALLNIARAAGNRATGEGTDRRVMLLLATRLARGAIGQLPHAACRIGAGAAFQMYAIPTASPMDWQLLELIGAARSRFLLRRCQELRPGDFASLADEYSVVSTLGDPDAILILSRQLAASSAQTGDHAQLQSQVKQNLNAAHFRATMQSAGMFDPEVEVDQQIHDLFKSRRFQRLRETFAVDLSGTDATSQISAASRDLVASACLLCGDSHTARVIWQKDSAADNDAENNARIGLTYLVEQEHPRALDSFASAVRIEPENIEAHCGMAICHLELGSASAAVAECDFMLGLPEISEGMQQFCERMREFAKRYVRDDK